MEDRYLFDCDSLSSIIDLETIDLNGKAITLVNVGEPFKLRASVSKDVFAVYMDITYDAGLASVDGSIHREKYKEGTNLNKITPGLLDDMGGFLTSADGFAQNGGGLLFSLPFRAEQSGTLKFTGRPPGRPPFTDMILFGCDSPVPPGNIDWGKVTILVNHPPVLTNPGNKVADEETAVLFKLSATDKDVVNGVPDTMSYSIVSGKLPGMTLVSSTGAFSWTPTEIQDGKQVVVFRATDNHGKSGKDQTVTITIREINDVPTLSGPAKIAVHERQALTFSLSSTDRDVVGGIPDAASFVIASGLKPGMTLSAGSGSFSWTPTEAQDGQSVVVFRATDQQNAGGIELTSTITVNEVNDPPVLANPRDQIITELESLALTLSATDGDVVAGVRDVVSYTIESVVQTGMSLNANTGAFAWTPSATQSGEHAITFRSADIHGENHAQSITITVRESNQAPTDISVSNLTVDENVAGALVGDVSVIDPNTGQTHTLVVADDRFEIVFGKLKLKAGLSFDFEVSASRAIEISATDVDSPPLSITKSFAVTVRDVNEPPLAMVLSAATIKENISGAVVGTLSATDQDLNQTHAFTTADARFEIAGGKLKLKDEQFADLDIGATIGVEVTATDSGTPARSTTQTLLVGVTANARAWRNGTQPMDTNSDGRVVPQDVLRIINQLNDPTIISPGGRLPEVRPATTELAFYDTNGDGFCTPIDVLRVINYLNNQLGEGATVEEVVDSDVSGESVGVSPWIPLPTTYPFGERFLFWPMQNTVQAYSATSRVAFASSRGSQTLLRDLSFERAPARPGPANVLSRLPPPRELATEVEVILDEIAEDITQLRLLLR